VTTSYVFQALGPCVPSAVAAQASLDVALGVTMPELQARLARLLEAQAQLLLSPPAFAATVVAVGQLAAGLAIAGELPALDAQLTLLASLIAELEAMLGQLEAQAAFAADFAVLLGTAGVHMYSFLGVNDAFSGEIASLTAGGFPGAAGSDEAVAIVIAATAPTARVAVGAFFGVEVSS
jgi:hypothetical protein